MLQSPESKKAEIIPGRFLPAKFESSLLSPTLSSTQQRGREGEKHSPMLIM
jgi:hypothetical protein